MTESPLPDLRIEPLKPSHDRTTFHCGVEQLDIYFRHQASQDAKRKVAAPFVMIEAGSGVVGYYTLSAYSIRLKELPESLSKKLPRYPLLPATLVGRLAVSQQHRGRNFGRLLLMDALHRSLKNAAEVASIGVVLEAYDAAAKAFYTRHEFTPIFDHPNKLFMAMTTIEKLFKAL